jgi:hypothetical protein
MAWPPTLYKARGMRKQPVCAICVERTRGETERVELGYGVSVWLCPDHASPVFLARRGGRDLVLTLQQLWQAHGCLTASRHKALTRHLDRLSGRNLRKAERPGSYAWPRLRRQAEQRFAGGAALTPTITALHRLFAADGPARAPSRRTVERWRTERRWLAPTWTPP